MITLSGQNCGLSKSEPESLSVLSSQGSKLKLCELIRACYLLNYPHILHCSQPRGQISLSFIRNFLRSPTKKFALPPIKISQVKMNRNSDIYGAERVTETERYKIPQIKIDRVGEQQRREN